MDKELNKAIMIRSKLRNKFLKLKIEENRFAYAKQRNYCVNFENQKSDSSITDNKLFWKIISPLFTEKKWV